MADAKIRFEPAEYSVQELRFLLTILGKPPVVVRDMTLPPGVVRAQALKLITACYELQEKFAHSEVPWVGYDRVREAIERTLVWYQTSAELVRRGGPKHPSMQTWDGNRFMPRGPESDSGMVRTEILSDGSRRPLGLDLSSPDGQGVGPNLIGAAPWLSPTGAGAVQDLLSSTPSALLYTVNEHSHTGTITCPICEWVESYSSQKANGKNLAMGRMTKHLKHSKTQKDKHSILYGRLTGKSIAA